MELVTTWSTARVPLVYYTTGHGWSHSTVPRRNSSRRHPWCMQDWRPRDVLHGASSVPVTLESSHTLRLALHHPPSAITLRDHQLIELSDRASLRRRWQCWIVHCLGIAIVDAAAGSARREESSSFRNINPVSR